MPRPATGRKNGRPPLLDWPQRIAIAQRVETVRTERILAATNALLEKRRPRVKRHRKAEQKRDEAWAVSVEREKKRQQAHPGSAPRPVVRGKLQGLKKRDVGIVVSQAGRRRVLNGEANEIYQQVAQEFGVPPRFVRRCCEEYRAWLKHRPPDPPYEPAPPGYPGR